MVHACLQYRCDKEKLWERWGCPVDVPYMSRICLVPYKIRDIYGATATHIQKIMCFSKVCQYIGLVQTITHSETKLMAKRSGPLCLERNRMKFSLWTRRKPLQGGDATHMASFSKMPVRLKTLDWEKKQTKYFRKLSPPWRACSASREAKFRNTESWTTCVGSHLWRVTSPAWINNPTPKTCPSIF